MKFHLYNFRLTFKPVTCKFECRQIHNIKYINNIETFIIIHNVKYVNNIETFIQICAKFGYEKQAKYISVCKVVIIFCLVCLFVCAFYV